MITLKHLSRTVDVDPYALRMVLRAAGLTPQVNKRWKWPDAKDPEYLKALKAGRAYASKTSGPTSSKSASSMQEADGAD